MGQQARVSVGDLRVDTLLGQGITDPLSGVQRDFPLGRQATSKYDDAFDMAHDF